MDFLPPKPPKMAGADNKKKNTVSSGEASSNNLLSIKDRAKQMKKYSASIDNKEGGLSSNAISNTLSDSSAEESLPVFSVPDISPIDEETIDKKINEIQTTQQTEPGKKKGFFGKLFGVKETDSSKKDLLTQGETTKEKEEEEVNNLRQALGMDDPSRKIALQEIEKTSDYVPRTSWDSEIVDISSYRKPDYKKSEDDILKEYKKSDYKKSGYAKQDKKTGEKKDGVIDVKKSAKKTDLTRIPKSDLKSDDWVADVALEKLNLPVVPSSVFNSSTTRNSSDKLNTKTENTITTSKIMTIPAANESAANKPMASQPQKDAFFKGESLWQKQVAELLSSSNIKDEKSVAQIELKLTKLLKTYDNNFSKIIADRRKAIAAELDKLSMKQEMLSQKEAKLKEKDAALQKKKDEIYAIPARIDELRKAEEQLNSTKEAYKKEFEGYKKGLSAIKADMINAQKSFDFERKEFNVQRRDMQIELKKFRNSVVFETKNGNAKLDALSKEVELAEAELEKTKLSVKKSMDALRTKEKELQNKENKITALLAQENKIRNTLRSEAKSSVAAMPKKNAEIVFEDNADSSAVSTDSSEQEFIDDEDEIRQKILDCKDFLKEENFEDAKMIYNEIREEFSNIELAEEKKIVLKQDIRELYDEICVGIVSVKKSA